MTLTERFLNYTQFDTQSSETSTTVPSTAKQLVFADYLREELFREGLADVEMDEKGYIYATLPATTDELLPTIGFIAHYDTSPDCSGADIRPRIVSAYDGTDIELREGMVLSPKMFPELLDHVGEDLIVTDGTTLLGADDKAGIAEIVEAVCYLRDHPEIRHGRIRIAFNPDEEIGMGAHHFDVKRFGCDWAYTMDGSEVGELEFENFNAASAVYEFHGRSVHPGYAKGKMLNAIRLAAQVVEDIFPEQSPEQTEGYEGFYHPTSIEGNVERARVSFIIRDHDRRNFENRKLQVQACADRYNEQYGEGTCSLTLTDTYYNMRERVEPQMHIIERAKAAMCAAGITPRVKPIRGGTDGAQLSFRGLPCPNIFAGGLNFHGPYEFVPIQSMQKAVDVIIGIAKGE